MKELIVERKKKKQFNDNNTAHSSEKQFGMLRVLPARKNQILMQAMALYACFK